jgi:hypothetical protein
MKLVHKELCFCALEKSLAYFLKRYDHSWMLNYKQISEEIVIVKIEENLLCWSLQRGIKKHEIYQSGYPICQPRFELGPSRILSGLGDSSTVTLLSILSLQVSFGRDTNAI